MVKPLNLQAQAERLGVTLGAEQERRIQAHLLWLEKWRHKLNLTSLSDDQNAVSRHVLDSLSVLPHLKGARVLDIGTGAGFPGMTLACADLDRQYTLLDSRGKRIEFLRFVAAHGGITNVNLVNKRIEDFSPVRAIDTLVARAVAPLPDLLRLSQHLHHVGMRFVAMKSRQADDEVADVYKNQALLRSGVNLDQLLISVKPVKIPGLAAERQLVIVDVVES